MSDDQPTSVALREPGRYREIEIAARGRAMTLQPKNFGEVIEFAKMMAQASFAVPKHLRENPGACMAVTMRSIGWEMDPFAVATKTYQVGDIISYEAQLVAAVVHLRAPIRTRPEVSYLGDGQTRQCLISVEMLEGSTKEYLSPEIGKILVKNSPLWKGDPDQQLYYYSIRAWARRYTPEVLLGVYTPDEAIEHQDEVKDRARTFSELEARAETILPAPIVVVEGGTFETGAPADPTSFAPTIVIEKGAKSPPQKSARPAETPQGSPGSATPASEGSAPAAEASFPAGSEKPTAAGSPVAPEEPEEPDFPGDRPSGQPAEEQVPAPAPEPPGGFVGFAMGVADANDWPTIEKALQTLNASPEWEEAGAPMRNTARRVAAERHRELGGAPTVSLQAYRCFLEMETSQKALYDARKAISEQPAFRDAATNVKVALDRAFDARMNTLNEGARP